MTIAVDMGRKATKTNKQNTTILYYDFDVFNLSRTFSVIWKGKSSYLFFNSCFQDKKMN